MSMTAIFEGFLNLLNEIKDDMIIYKTMSKSYTKVEMLYELTNQTECGKQYINDCLRVCRDLLIRQANKK